MKVYFQVGNNKKQKPKEMHCVTFSGVNFCMQKIIHKKFWTNYPQSHSFSMAESTFSAGLSNPILL